MNTVQALRDLASALETYYEADGWPENVKFLRALADKLEAEERDKGALSEHWNG